MALAMFLHPNRCAICSLCHTPCTVHVCAQVAVIQSDARAELEAAQTRMQLLRLKQQRMAKYLAGSQLPAASDTLAAWRDKD
jgi:hypothetical protein